MYAGVGSGSSISAVCMVVVLGSDWARAAQDAATMSISKYPVRAIAGRQSRWARRRRGILRVA